MRSNTLWNTKYGMHSNVRGWFTGNPTTPMTLTAEEAETFAQYYLDGYVPRTTVSEADAFYGYYDVMVLSNG